MTVNTRLPNVIIVATTSTTSDDDGYAESKRTQKRVVGAWPPPPTYVRCSTAFHKSSVTTASNSITTGSSTLSATVARSWHASTWLLALLVVATVAATCCADAFVLQELPLYRQERMEQQRAFAPSGGAAPPVPEEEPTEKRSAHRRGVRAFNAPRWNRVYGYFSPREQYRLLRQLSVDGTAEDRAAISAALNGDF